MHLRTSLLGIAVCGMTVAGTTGALAYSVNDARYVTTSTNPNVLQYIVCLEGVVQQAPRSVSIPDALVAAQQSCAPWALRLPRTASEPDAETIVAMISECGFRQGEASPDADCGNANTNNSLGGFPPNATPNRPQWPPGALTGNPLGTGPPGTRINPPGMGPPGTRINPPAPWPPGGVAANPPAPWPPGAAAGNPLRTGPPGTSINPPGMGPPGTLINPPAAWPPGAVAGHPPRTDPPGFGRAPGNFGGLAGFPQRGPIGIAQADHVTLTPRVIELGKWVEGIADDGHLLWVAESGQRTIAKVDLGSGRVLGRVKVGRLPVDMVAMPNGTIYTMVVTDRAIWRQDGNGRGSIFTKLPDCPDDLIFGAGFLWALTEPDCSSSTSRLIRIDPRTAQQTASRDLGEWALAITSYDTDIWVGHARGPTVTVVDQRSLRVTPVEVPGTEFWALSSNSRNVFGGGRVSGTDGDGLIVMFDPRRRTEIGRASVSERVTKIVSDEDHVIAAGDKGTLWVFSASDLSLQRTITLAIGTYEPHALLFVGDQLVISAINYQGDNGALFVLNNYLPASRPSFGGGGGRRGGGTATVVPSQPGLMLSVGGSGPVTDFTLIDDSHSALMINWVDGKGVEFLAGGGAISPGQSWRVENGARGYETHWYSIRSGGRLVCTFALRQGAVVRLSQLSACRL